MEIDSFICKIKNLNLALLIISSLIVGGPLWASQGISVASGFGVAHIVPIRIGFQKEFEKQWNTESDWPIGGYWEGSVYSMNGHKGRNPNSHKRLEALALAGVFRMQRRERFSFGWPYVDLGVGLSWLTRKEIGGRDLGIHFQFEDRIGIGFRFGQDKQYDIGYRAIHFSNAYIGPSNHGINLHVIVLGYWFN